MVERQSVKKQEESHASWGLMFFELAETRLDLCEPDETSIGIQLHSFCV